MRLRDWEFLLFRKSFSSDLNQINEMAISSKPFFLWRKQGTFIFFIWGSGIEIWAFFNWRLSQTLLKALTDIFAVLGRHIYSNWTRTDVKKSKVSIGPRRSELIQHKNILTQHIKCNHWCYWLKANITIFNMVKSFWIGAGKRLKAK